MLVYCMNFKKIGKVLTSKSVGNGPSSYEKRIYLSTVSQRLRNTGLEYVQVMACVWTNPSMHHPRCVLCKLGGTGYVKTQLSLVPIY